jgi:microcystin-dependent protein
MSNCSNCYNGCTEIVSDRCVRYTGIDVPVLGIKTGDSLSFVEQALITFLTSTLDGTGIKIDLGTTVVCNLVQQYLPTCGDLTIVDISKALIEAACDLQEQVDAIDNTLTILNADYTLPANCLTGVTASSDTHAIVQAVINTLCTLKTDFTLLLASLPNTYVSIDDIDTYIQAYIDGTSSGSLYSSRMVPYGVVAYYGPLTNFNSTGAGIGNWQNIYLCNGNNGTPDLRGRVIVGAINGVPGPTMNPAVDPAVSGNPNYSLGGVAGTNQVTLSLQEMPNHNHNLVTVVSTDVTDPGHSHTFQGVTNSSGDGNGSRQSVPTTRTTDPALTGITVDVNVDVTCQNNGGGLPHTNIQPVNAAYYIIYLP